MKPDLFDKIRKLKREMDNIHELVEQQFEYNRGKNLFHQGIVNLLHFSPATVRAIEDIDDLDAAAEAKLLDYLTKRAIEEFCRINQYYVFDTLAQKELQQVYLTLFTAIKKQGLSIDAIAQQHYNMLIAWLQASNGFAERLYALKGKDIEPVVCAEYSAAMQLELFHIVPQQLMQPVLDVGCGQQGTLVAQLCGLGISAQGFDRFAAAHPFLSVADWLEYRFEPDSWGTVISNLGFSNHFQHHHQRTDGNFVVYAQTYMEILRSLKKGGSFFYAPDLPFIEQYLDTNLYQITKYDVGNYGFKASRVTRLK